MPSFRSLDFFFTIGYHSTSRSTLSIKILNNFFTLNVKIFIIHSLTKCLQALYTYCIAKKEIIVSVFLCKLDFFTSYGRVNTT